MFFQYGEAEIAHLTKRDKRLGAAIDRIGRIERRVQEDLFSSVVFHIVGQQISTAAQATVWRRMNDALGEISARTIDACTIDDLQKHGITFRKAGYMKSFADKVADGILDLETLRSKSDAEVIAQLSALKGIGVWTAEMIMTFCMQRPDILSFGDLAIHRGMRMLYRRPAIGKELFEIYRRRYSPYGTVASLYLWTIANGAIVEVSDCAPGQRRVKA